jgi:hypothetical protein
MIELLLAVLAGAVLNLLFSLNDIFGKPEFSWKIFFQQNAIPTVLNLVCGTILVWFRDDIASIFPLGGLSSVFLGLGGQTVFKKLQNMFDSKVNTYVGVNNN